MSLVTCQGWIAAGFVRINTFGALATPWFILPLALLMPVFRPTQADCNGLAALFAGVGPVTHRFLPQVLLTEIQ